MKEFHALNNYWAMHRSSENTKKNQKNICFTKASNRFGGHMYEVFEEV